MVLSAISFVALRNELPAWYNGDPSVVALAAALLPIAGAFQVFDGVQVVGGGVLRGMGRTRPAAGTAAGAGSVARMPVAPPSPADGLWARWREIGARSGESFMAANRRP